MKFKQFLHKMFPCMSKEQHSPQSEELKHQKEFFEEQLSKERQKRLEELRQVELEQEQQKQLEKQRLENELLAREEFERILKESEERAEEEARQRAEEEARQRAEEEARQRAEEEARQHAEEEARQHAEEARQRAEEEARQHAEEEARQRDEEEESRQRAQKNRLKVIDIVFSQYKEQYHEFYSMKQQPIHSNFNEKMFKELCNTFTFTSEEELLSCLNDYNSMQKQNKSAYNQLSTKRRLKCDVFNFYLFINCGHHLKN